MSAQLTERPPAPASPLPDVIRLTVPAQYDGEDWFTFNADKTAAEVPAALRDRYPHLAAVTLDEFGGWVHWLRVIERLSFDSPVERYRLCGLSRTEIDSTSSDDDLLHVRLVRLGCDDPGPEVEVEPTAARRPEFDRLLKRPFGPRMTERAKNTGGETKPMIATETPAAEFAADEAALAAASVPPERSSKAPVPAPGALAVTVAREPLRTALRTVVTAAASGRVIAPVTTNVLIDAYPTAVSLTCTDLNQRLTVEVTASTEGNGAYTVPAKLLSQLVDTFTAPDVTLRQDGEVLRVTSGKSRGHLKGIDAAEFPEDRQDGGDTCTLPAAVLRRALTLAEWAAARDESRPVLKCVNLAAASGRLVAQSADGNCLSYWAVPLAGVPDCTVLLPRDAAETMARLLAAREGDVTLSLLPGAAQPNVLRLALGGELPAMLTTRTSEGQFPNLLRVVPKTHTLAITVQRAALLGAVRQAGVVADRAPGRDGFRPMVLVNLRAEPGAEGNEGALHVWSTNASVGEQRTEIAASITHTYRSERGEPLHFKLDGTYLIGLLGALDEALEGALEGEPGDTDDGAVTLRLTKASNPVRIGCAALPEWIGVVMPMSGGAE